MEALGREGLTRSSCSRNTASAQADQGTKAGWLFNIPLLVTESTQQVKPSGVDRGPGPCCSLGPLRESLDFTQGQTQAPRHSSDSKCLRGLQGVFYRELILQTTPGHPNILTRVLQ